MKKIERHALRIAFGIASLSCLCSCIREKQLHRQHQDPSTMTQETDRENKAETLINIEQQEKKDRAARERQVNEIIEKQLRGRTDNK